MLAGWDCTVKLCPLINQHFSSSNHPCPYLRFPPIRLHGNHLCLIRLLFTEWHSNDHFMDQWNAPIWIRKYRRRWNNDDTVDVRVCFKSRKVSIEAWSEVDAKSPVEMGQYELWRFDCLPEQENPGPWFQWKGKGQSSLALPQYAYRETHCKWNWLFL